MSAVDDLLVDLNNIDGSLDFAGNTLDSSRHDVLLTLSRGAAVQGLVAFESFLQLRAAEWTHALNLARISPTHWPGGASAIQGRMIAALPRRYRDLPSPQRGILIDELGKSFSSFTSPSMVSHYLSFSWSGSNVQLSDIENVLTMSGLGGGPWSEMTALWKRVDPRFPNNVSAKSLFESVSTLRHDAAHSASPSLPMANLLSITRNVRLLALLVDALMSACLSATARMTTPQGVKGSTLPIRKVVKDKGWYREFGPSQSGKRAQARYPDIASAVTAAAQHAASGSELVLVLDGNDIVDWRASI